MYVSILERRFPLTSGLTSGLILNVHIGVTHSDSDNSYTLM